MIKSKVRNLFCTNFKFFKPPKLSTVRCLCTKMDLQIAFPDTPVYLEKCNEPTIINGDLIESRKSNFFTKQHDIFIFYNQPPCRKDEMTNYLKSSIDAQSLYRTVSSKLHSDVCLNCLTPKQKRIWPFEIFRGICVYPLKSDESFSKDSLFSITRKHGFESYFDITSISDTTCNIKEVDLGTLNITSEQLYTVKDSWIKGSDKVTESVLFSYPDLCPVFHEYKQVKELLNKCLDIPEVVTLLGIAEKIIPGNFDVHDLQSQLQHPFVVVEGLDATGKTTLTETLEKKLQAVRYYTPPPEIQHLRKYFDTLPEIIRRAYYCIGNYIVAIEIAKECQQKPVIMDRYWHSTTAYGIANESSTADLPDKHHWVYQWPGDLLKPTLVLFLTVTEEVRRQRLSGRGGEKTFEEKHLNKDVLFRQRLCEAYRRMENPGCVEIDASGSKETVVQLAVDELQKHGINF